VTYSLFSSLLSFSVLYLALGRQLTIILCSGRGLLTVYDEPGFGVPGHERRWIDGVILESGNPDDYRKAAPIVKKHNLKMYAWYISMNAEHDADSLIAHHRIGSASIEREGALLIPWLMWAL
jgi:hypothetical protein